jgi:hypothetical protein
LTDLVRLCVRAPPAGADQSTWTVDLIGVDGKTLASCGFSEASAASAPTDPPCREPAGP